MPSASTQAAESRGERLNVISGLMGCQATLGHHPASQCTVQLRTKTLWNAGTAKMRQMHMGGMNAKVLRDNMKNERLDEEFMLVEGIDNAVEKRPAYQCWMQNGMRRHNSNIDFGASRNDPTALFQHVTCAFSLLDALTNAVDQSFTARLAATCTLMDVAQDPICSFGPVI
jgi:hypothetical protein